MLTSEHEEPSKEYLLLETIAAQQTSSTTSHSVYLPASESQVRNSNIKPQKPDASSAASGGGVLQEGNDG